MSKNRFGNDIFIKLDGFDRNYITNSYHIPVFEPIDAFEKLRIESKFQKLSPGGAISYIETPSMIQKRSCFTRSDQIYVRQYYVCRN